jgi:hypothetical protein
LAVNSGQATAITGAADRIGRPCPIMSGPSVRQIRLSQICYLMRILYLSIAMLLTASGNAAEVPFDAEQILKLEDDCVRAFEKHNRESLNKILAREFEFIEPDGTLKKSSRISRQSVQH